MEDKTLLRISLFLSIVGLIALFLIGDNFAVSEINASNIDDIAADKTVKIKGTLERLANSNNATFLKVSQECSADIMVFDKINMSNGEEIEITGKISEYNNKKEIIADKIVIR